MNGYNFGQGQPTDTGAKAYHLDLAASLGLPVPQGAGYVVPNDHPETLESLAHDVVSRIPGSKFAVRSSFRGEDSDKASQAGRYDSLLRVAPHELADAIGKVYRSAGEGHQAVRGVVVQTMVDAKHAGVMFCQPNFLDPLVSWVEGTAEHLVGGEEQGQTEELGPGCKGLRARVRQLGLHAQSSLGIQELGWDIEWADDGHTAWLVQARPITRPPLRNELFSYANIREIMPDPPSVFMASVVERAGLTLYEYYRAFDKALPTGRPLIELQMGRPLFNISLLCETMRHWGLPTRLVTDQIGGADVAGAELQLGQFFSKWQPILRQGLSQFSVVGKTKREIARLQQFQPAMSLGEMGQQTVELFHRLVTVMLDLTAALAVPLTLLRKLGVLAQHSAHHQTPTGQILRSLEPLRELVSQHPQWHEALSQGTAPASPEFAEPWHHYLNRYGHRGFFESDLAEPRFRELPETILRSLLSPPLSSSPQRKSLLGQITAPLWLYTKRILDTRENWRNEAMIVYQALRESILETAAVTGLEEPSKIFELNLEEWARLDDGWRPEQNFWATRQTEIAQNKRYLVPDLIHRFQSRQDFLEESSDEELDRTVTGLPLTKGTVEGLVWVAGDAREIPDLEGPIVLVVRTVDPGWLFNLPRLSGAIVELGGDLSHGSILLREFGIPAITNAAGATRVFQTGDEVRLIAHEGMAVRLSR